MKSENIQTRLLALFVTIAILVSFNGPTFAIDDGARAYWKARDGKNGVSFQYLNLNMQASGAEQFDPGHFIYPNSDTEADLMITNYARHFTLFKRPSSLGVAIAGGSVDVNVDTSLVAPGYLPPGVAPTSTFRQSASGYADPTVQLDINLLGTSPLKSTVDLVNYEPTLTLDTAVMLALPVGEYDDDKLVNMGLNRWYGRIAFPFKYHFGVFTPGYMSSLELIPSVWLFAENDDFMGQKLENEPLYQFEAHLTHDFTRTFFGSLDLLYRRGFQSEVDGVELGSELEIGDLGFSMNYNVTDNFSIRTGFSSNVFGDEDIDSSIIRIQFVYAWHTTEENLKKLKHGH
jgi:hypothetical protein